MERRCDCLTSGPRHPNIVENRFAGVDETNGRFADVRITKCDLCGRLWLRYQVEYEGFSRSGRWAEALIDGDTAKRITAEQASAFIETQNWYVFSGSYCGWRSESASKRRRGKSWHGICRDPIRAKGLDGRPPVNAVSRRRRWPKASVYRGFAVKAHWNIGGGADLPGHSTAGTMATSQRRRAVYARILAAANTYWGHAGKRGHGPIKWDL